MLLRVAITSVLLISGCVPRGRVAEQPSYAPDTTPTSGRIRTAALDGSRPIVAQLLPGDDEVVLVGWGGGETEHPPWVGSSLTPEGLLNLAARVSPQVWVMRLDTVESKLVADGRGVETTFAGVVVEVLKAEPGVGPAVGSRRSLREGYGTVVVNGVTVHVGHRMPFAVGQDMLVFAKNATAADVTSVNAIGAPYAVGAGGLRGVPGRSMNYSGLTLDDVRGAVAREK